MLTGTLDDFTLPDIFRLLSQSNKTGRLDVERSAGRGNVFFKEGNVYFAESTLSHELVGQKLLKAKIVTEGQLMSALDEQAESGGRVGEVLRGAGLVTEDQLGTALRSQIEDAVFDLLRWEAGKFDWVPGATIEAEISLSVSVENLIMEGSRRLDEMAIITRKIPSEHSLVEMAPAPPDGAAEINITPDEWRVLVLVDGQRTALGIAEAVGSDVFTTMRTLYGLSAAGLVHVPGHVVEDDDEPLPELPLRSETHDAVIPDLVADHAGVDGAATMVELDDMDLPTLVEDAGSEDAGPDADAGTEEDTGTEDSGTEDSGAREDTRAEEDAHAEEHAGAREDTRAEEDARPEEDAGTEDTGADVAAAPLEATELPTSEWFDVPEPGDIMASEPSVAAEEVVDADPFAVEILAPPEVAEEADPEPVAVEQPPEPVAEPAAEHDGHDDHGSEHSVDKRDAVRELSDLFKQTEVDSRPTFLVPEIPEKNGTTEPPRDESRHRVEDDEEITRGLISRLIDGVKGL